MTRRGITVLEVIVIVAVLVIAVGLMALFLVRLRETGQRVQCENHLKSIGEAIRRYHDGSAGDDKLKRLPPSRIDDGNATWAVLIAPHLAAENPLKNWDVERTYFAQPHEVRQATLLPYFCPARPRTGALSMVGDDLPAKGHHAGALGDYAAVAGNGSLKHPWTTDEANGALIRAVVLKQKEDRIVQWESLTSLASITRGESVTLVIGEKHIPVGQFGDAAVGDGSLYNGANPASFSRVAGPGFPIAESVEAPFNKNFGSFHRNGACPFVRADTSVLWMMPDVSEEVLGKISTRGE
jgi:hypothetical protein